LKPCCGFISPS